MRGPKGFAAGVILDPAAWLARSRAGLRGHATGRPRPAVHRTHPLREALHRRLQLRQVLLCGARRQLLDAGDQRGVITRQALHAAPSQPHPRNGEQLRTSRSLLIPGRGCG
jgi:hypothetical protein